MTTIKNLEMILKFLHNHSEILVLQKKTILFVPNITYLTYKIIKILIFSRN